MSPPNQGFRYSQSLVAASTTVVLSAACGASRGGGIQLSGTFSATVQFEQSIDNGATWIAKTVFPAAGGAGVTSATATGQWKFGCGGETHVRVRCSAYTSGTIVVDTTFTAGVDVAALPGGSSSGPLPVYTPLTLRATQAQTVTAALYAAGNQVGTKLTFASMARATGQGGVLQTAILRDKAGQNVAYDLFLFDADPTNTTFTDKTAAALNTADVAKLIGVVQFGGIALGAASTMGVLTAAGLGLAYKLTSGTSIFGMLVTRGAPTYASTSDVSVDLIALPD